MTIFRPCGVGLSTSSTRGTKRILPQAKGTKDPQKKVATLGHIRWRNVEWENAFVLEAIVMEKYVLTGINGAAFVLRLETVSSFNAGKTKRLKVNDPTAP